MFIKQAFHIKKQKLRHFEYKYKRKIESKTTMGYQNIFRLNHFVYIKLVKKVHDQDVRCDEYGMFILTMT